MVPPLPVMVLVMEPLQTPVKSRFKVAKLQIQGTFPLKVKDEPTTWRVLLLPKRRRVAPSLRMIGLVMLSVPLFLAIMNVTPLLMVMLPVPPTVISEEEPALSLSQPPLTMILPAPPTFMPMKTNSPFPVLVRVPFRVIGRGVPLAPTVHTMPSSLFSAGMVPVADHVWSFPMMRGHLVIRLPATIPAP